MELSGTLVRELDGELILDMYVVDNRRCP
jgi:hypothetical protein